MLFMKPSDIVIDKLRNFAQARFYYRKASHLNPEDAKLLFKIAGTYINEKNWSQSVKYLEMALRINRNNPEFNLAMGEVLMKLGKMKEAIQHLSLVVENRPRNAGGWEALIRCLYDAGYLEEAEKQVQVAFRIRAEKLFSFFIKVPYCLPWESQKKD